MLSLILGNDNNLTTYILMLAKMELWKIFKHS